LAPSPSPPLPSTRCISFSVCRPSGLLKGKGVGRREEGKSKFIRRRESLVLHNPSTTLCNRRWWGGGGKEFVGFTDYLFYLSCVPWLQDLFVNGISPLLVYSPLTCLLFFSQTTNARQINLQINKQVCVWFYCHIMNKKKTKSWYIYKSALFSVRKMQDFVHFIFV
jgi:hypothetical protein